MKSWKGILFSFASGLLSAGMPLLWSQPVQALSAAQINDIAFDVTVLIRGSKGHGSGFIISQQGEVYHALTACHVVNKADTFKLITTKDKRAYLLNSKECITNTDLAVVSFSSKQAYQVATLANSATLKVGNPVFISGWPAPGSATPNQLVRQFTGGQVSAFLDQSFAGGYQVSYTNITRGGMSGGPVLDSGGRVVGIHGIGDTETSDRLAQLNLSAQEATNLAGIIKPGFNYAMPMALFLKRKPTSLALQVENSAASALQGDLVAEAPAEKRDRIKNLTQTLSGINSGLKEGVGILNTLKGLFR